jgi:hypothetical protein
LSKKNLFISFNSRSIVDCTIKLDSGKEEKKKRENPTNYYHENNFIN